MSRPDLVKQVLEYAQSNGIAAARQKVEARLETLSALGYSCSGFVLEAGAGVTWCFRLGDLLALRRRRLCQPLRNQLCARKSRGPHSGWVVSLQAASLTTIGAIVRAGCAPGKCGDLWGNRSRDRRGLGRCIGGSGLAGAGCRVIAIERTSDHRAARAISSRCAYWRYPPAIPHSRTKSAQITFSRYGVDAVLITAAATKSAELLELAAKLLREIKMEFRGRRRRPGRDLTRQQYHKEISLSHVPLLRSFRSRSAL